MTNEITAKIVSLAHMIEHGHSRVTLGDGLTIGLEPVERTVSVVEEVVRCSTCYSTASCQHHNWRVVLEQENVT